MDPMDGAASTSTLALPGWIRVLWIAALLGAAVIHLRHTRRARGWARWWHTGHTTMAIGMALMYLVDRMEAAAVDQALLLVFALLALAALIAVVRRPESLRNVLWWGGTLDLLAMVFMVLPAQDRTSLATRAVLIYLGVQVVACARSRWFPPPSVGGLRQEPKPWPQRRFRGAPPPAGRPCWWASLRRTAQDSSRTAAQRAPAPAWPRWQHRWHTCSR